MARRDPIKTARNKLIAQMTEELRFMLPKVLEETGFTDEASLNAKIGGKAAEFIDLHHEVILSPDQYLTCYMKGFKAALSPKWAKYKSTHDENYEAIKKSKIARTYFTLFLKRSYLKHFEELSRVRPRLDDSEIWIGQNKANYGLFITPRFYNGKWENDRSEIRHFPRLYWTIGHILESGLVVDGDPDKIEFASVESYLKFFKHSLVRLSGSPYELAIASRYIEYVRASDDPERVPLLIPEYRYNGREKEHIYRLDFCVIDPFSMQKIGYELSPWSTHGYLKSTGKLSQKKINEMASDNFGKEMKKHRDYFEKHNIYALIYTDEQLKNIDAIFDDMTKYLKPVEKVVQLDFALLENFFD